MNIRCKGDKFQIQCYKHNKKIHRSWDEAVLLREEKKYMVFANDKTLVTESDGSSWKTKEPAIMYFFKDEWFNIIAQLKKDGIYYYCNIATPFIIEEGTIKYIDYDLDLRIFPTGEYKILDKLEYEYHKKIMNYSEDLDKVITDALKDLITEYKNGAVMFDANKNKEYCQLYYKLLSDRENSNFC